LPAAYGIADTAFVNKIGTLLEVFGILGGILYSVVLTWYPGKLIFGAYSYTIGLIVTLAFYYYVATLGDRTWLSVASSSIGFFLFPFIFVAFEIAVEQTAQDGVGDTLSCGLINVLANTVGFVLVLSLTPLLTKESEGATGATFAILFANLGLALVFLILGSVFTAKKK